MNQEKSNTSLLKTVGIALLSVGIAFTILGIVLLTIPSLVVVGILLMGFNAQFLMVGIVFILNDRSKKNRMKSILEEGYSIQAEVTDISSNTASGKSVVTHYIISAKYEDETGSIHIFKSPELNFNPDGMLLDQMVRIFIKPGDYQYYYMDLESILPKEKISN